MLQALLIEPDDLVLEVGSGSGFISACLALLGRQVTSIDISDTILNIARQNVTAYALDNIDFKQADGYEFQQNQAYDVVAVTGSVAVIPENLKKALKIGGRLFIIVGQSPAMQALLITHDAESVWTTQSLFETDLPRLSR
jgi:protein-L-isoaspartate(D-aspartate) O-methyltransferase